MAYIYLDESGDLGFDFNKKKTSKNFVVTCLFIENRKPIEKIVKKTHSELKKKYKKDLEFYTRLKKNRLPVKDY